MNLKLNPQGCEFCNGTFEVRICKELRSNGQVCGNRVCKKHSYGTSTEYICPECDKSLGVFAA